MPWQDFEIQAPLLLFLKFLDAQVYKEGFGNFTMLWGIHKFWGNKFSEFHQRNRLIHNIQNLFTTGSNQLTHFSRFSSINLNVACVDFYKRLWFHLDCQFVDHEGVSYSHQTDMSEGPVGMMQQSQVLKFRSSFRQAWTFYFQLEKINGLGLGLGLIDVEVWAHLNLRFVYNNHGTCLKLGLLIARIGI